MGRKVNLPVREWKKVVEGLVLLKVNTKRERELAKIDSCLKMIRETLGHKFAEVKEEKVKEEKEKKKKEK